MIGTINGDYAQTNVVRISNKFLYHLVDIAGTQMEVPRKIIVLPYNLAMFVLRE